MKAFYSLVKVSPNPSADDSITIGLILADSNEVKFKYSELKLKYLRNFVKNTSLVEFVLTKISERVKDTNLQIQQSKSELFEIDHFFKFEYFSYLRNYNNNLIRFSDPKMILSNENQATFDNIYSIFVEPNETQEVHRVNLVQDNFHDKIEQNLISRVKDKVHTKVIFDEKIIPSLYFKFEMDCIGLNGVFTGAKSLLFNKTFQTLHSHVSDYVTLITEIEKKYNKVGDNKFYLIADEPNQNTKEHELWTKVRSLTKLKLITSDEVELVAENIETSGAGTFIN